MRVKALLIDFLVFFSVIFAIGCLIPALETKSDERLIFGAVYFNDMNGYFWLKMTHISLATILAMAATYFYRRLSSRSKSVSR